MTHKLVQNAIALLPKSAPKALRTALGEFYAGATDDDLSQLNAEDLATIAKTHWEMSSTRKKGKPALRIYTIGPVKKGPGGRTIIDIVNDDMAFLVDSVSAEITRHGKQIQLLLHPVLHAQFAGKGKLSSLTATSTKGDTAQSHMHIVLRGALSKGENAQIERDILGILKDVHAANRDWPAMREKMHEAQDTLRNAPSSYDKEEINEYINFLDYLYNDNFTLLGCREYKFVKDKNGDLYNKVVDDSSLGVLHDEDHPVYESPEKDGLPQDLQKLRFSLPPLAIGKLNKRSTIHRRVPLDAIAVKRFDKKGNVVGEILFIGLLTSVTYSRSIQDIPLLRRKAELVLSQTAYRPGTHNFKALKHILERYPRDELFQIEIPDLINTVTGILRLQECQRIALYTRRDPFRRYISCLVYVPRDRYETRLRMTFQTILEEELNGVCQNFHTTLDDSVLARVIFIIATEQSKTPSYDTARIEARLQEAGRAWPERLADALLQADTDEAQIPDIVQKFGGGFSSAYTDEYSPKQAVYDIQKMGEALGENRLAMDLYRCKMCTDNQLRLKLYQKDTPVILSDILPILENMGLQVLSELPFEITLDNGDAVWIQDVMMATIDSHTPEHIEITKAKFEDALLRIWQGAIENDSLNRLVLGAQMDWRDIMLLRAYTHYMRQMQIPYSLQLVERTLYKNAAISRQIINLFKALHDPQSHDADKAARFAEAIDGLLEKVESLEEDRTLRIAVGLVQSTLRTNFFQPDDDGQLKTYVSFKLDSRSVADLPEPRPYREIFVYSPRVEGVHLRGDVIARGGIRWSDRLEDFRTEVLGLMRAQQVKNALIVPMGAKGGFVVKNPPAMGGRPAFLQEGIACYKIFINSLLDITDNRKGKKVIPPQNVVRHDGDDPYLVVAADKGTATFSDIANGLSLDHEFWLGDAFASGGSAGYDHKKMGITARGAWESVKRHFRELNTNIQDTPFDVIGVGDMGGDVFGNGMLLSPCIRLVGAFNHMHIFCDPNPDPAVTLKERQRLFDAVKGWEEYDTSKLSKGGRIFSRSEKSLSLTPEIMARFEITKDKVTPYELIQAMLRARTDLLWFGGIGTYIKASHQTHADVGDKANDNLRINAHEIRAKVLGEGANLAITQSGRIEFAQHGGKINTDFIDNSGGVNSSDIEVNIKILMNQIMSNPKTALTTAQRNKLLASMTEEVAELVLTNNYQQSQGISLMEFSARETLAQQADLIDELERKHGLIRKLEGLPDSEDIADRMLEGRGLTRPELALVQSYAKIMLTTSIIASDIPDMPEMEAYWLFNYFPTALQKKYAAEIPQHRLHREIVATALANAMVNRMGPTFVKEMMDKTGAKAADVAKAYIIVRDAFDLRRLWTQIEALDNKVAAQAQLAALRAIVKMVERETLWFLTRRGRRIDIKSDIENFRAGVDVLRENLVDAVTESRRVGIRARKQAAIDEGLPLALAHEIALISPLGSACDIIRISLDMQTDLLLTARVFFELGDYFQLHWLREQARAVKADSRWISEAVAGIIDSLYNAQAGLTIRILQDMKKNLAKISSDEGAIINTWISEHAPQAQLLEPFFSDIKRAPVIDVAILTLAVQRLRQLYGG